MLLDNIWAFFKSKIEFVLGVDSRFAKHWVYQRTHALIFEFRNLKNTHFELPCNQNNKVVSTIECYSKTIMFIDEDVDFVASTKQ
jgi:hypothetical protein